MKEYFANFSGGRSSAVMVHEIIKRKMPLTAVIFSNTGMETHETIEFIKLFNENILRPSGVKLHVIEFVAEKGLKKKRHREISIDDCDMTGEVFFSMVKHSQALPSAQQRHCTSMLKIQTSARFIKERYKCKDYTVYIGFRADEPRRIANRKARNEIYEAKQNTGKSALLGEDYSIMPLYDIGYTKQDVWDVIDSWEWAKVAQNRDTRLSNCKGCFMSGIKEQLDTFKTRGDIADVWKKMEAYKNSINKQKNESIEKKIFFVRNFNEIPQDKDVVSWTFNREYSWEVLERIYKTKDDSSFGSLFDSEVITGCDSGCFTD